MPRAGRIAPDDAVHDLIGDDLAALALGWFRRPGGEFIRGVSDGGQTGTPPDSKKKHSFDDCLAKTGVLVSCVWSRHTAPINIRKS
jgi:hypothetical protein